MNIVILGAGSIGTFLATTLSQEGHNVIVIDRDPKTLEKIHRYADVATRSGSGTDWQLLEDLLDQAPDLFIALSSDDETNLIACMIAKNLGYPKTVARIRGDNYLDRSRLDFGRLFFVDHFIATELIVAHDIVKCILNPGNMAIEVFAHGAVQMRTVVIPKDWPYAGKKLSTLNLPDQLLVGLIYRNSLIFPHGHDVLLSGDEVTFIGETAAMDELWTLLDAPQKKVSSVAIVGGTSVAMHICTLLTERKVHVKIIEQDEKKCLELAQKLPEATVLNQNGTDLNFLMEEKIELSDVFVACTHSTETNVLAAALGKQAGCPEVVALISDTSFAPLLKTLSINYALSERVSISNRIHALLHSGGVISIASLYENQAKIFEVKVSSDSEIIGIPIADLGAQLPKNFLIALIENRGRIMIAKGNHILAPGDTVIILCSPEQISEVERLF